MAESWRFFLLPPGCETQFSERTCAPKHLSLPSVPCTTSLGIGAGQLVRERVQSSERTICRDLNCLEWVSGNGEVGPIGPIGLI